MNTGQSGVGEIEALWRYPVKSMQGETSSTASVDARGVFGDRAHAILDVATGRIASAKHPHLWATLLRCRATYVEPPCAQAQLPPVLITLPDGRRVRSDDEGVHAMLSRLLGREVRLIRASTVVAGALREADRTPLHDGEASPAPDPLTANVREEPLGLAAPPGTVFDVAPLHVLTSTTLARLGALRPGSEFDVRRFRPNIVLTWSEAGGADRESLDGLSGFVENGWIGRTLILGDLRLAVIDPTPRCVVTTLAQADLPSDPGVLRTVARANAATSATLAPGVRFPAVVGVYATIERPGNLRVGTPASLA